MRLKQALGIRILIWIAAAAVAGFSFKYGHFGGTPDKAYLYGASVGLVIYGLFFIYANWIMTYVFFACAVASFLAGVAKFLELSFQNISGFTFILSILGFSFLGGLTGAWSGVIDVSEEIVKCQSCGWKGSYNRWAKRHRCPNCSSDVYSKVQ